MATNKPKTTPWNKIKAEYLAGATPKELASKYELEASTIHKKACRDKWTEEKESIKENLQSDIQERIKTFTDTALNALNKVLNDDKARQSDKIAAARAILDISGLKSQKIENTNNGDIQVVINRKPIKKQSPD